MANKKGNQTTQLIVRARLLGISPIIPIVCEVVREAFEKMGLPDCVITSAVRLGDGLHPSGCAVDFDSTEHIEEPMWFTIEADVRDRLGLRYDQAGKRVAGDFDVIAHAKHGGPPDHLHVEIQPR